MTDLELIEAVVSLAKNLLAERKKYERISTRAHTAETPKQHQKANADLNWQAMAMLKLETQLHVACVDAGLADLRDASHYAEKHFYPSGWHHYVWTPPQPKALAV